MCFGVRRMTTIKIADIVIDADLRYSINEKMLAAYKCEGVAAFTARCTDSQIEKELALSEIKVPAYCENACICRSVAEQIIDYDRLLFHSAVVEIGGKAIAFAAKSGTGKSTHVKLWLKNFADCKILNGDKPFFAYDSDGFTVYGSPWQGKENYGYNGKARLCGICFLTRSKENKVRKMSPEEAFGKAFLQVSFPQEVGHRLRITELLHTLTKSVPCYELFCNMEDNAAITAREAFKI